MICFVNARRGTWILRHDVELVVISNKILMISHVISERAVKDPNSVSRFLTATVLQKIVHIIVVVNLCLVLQVEYEVKTKECSICSVSACRGDRDVAAQRRLIVVPNKILKISQAISERTVRDLNLVSRFSMMTAMLQEMVLIRVVVKLCLVMQVEYEVKTKGHSICSVSTCRGDMDVAAWRQTDCGLK